MSDKSLRFMDKTQLLNIMRQQEIEIERLGAENEKLNASKGEQIEKLQAEVARLESENAGLAAQKNEQAAIDPMEIEKIEIEKTIEINKIKTEAQKKIDEAANLISERDGQIGAQNAKIAKLLAGEKEKDEQIAGLDIEVAEQNRQIERLLAEIELLAERPVPELPQLLTENPGSLAEASISVAGVMQAAQEAADLYLQNIKQWEAESAAAAKRAEEEAEKKAKAIIDAAEKSCKELENAAKKSVSEIQDVSSLYMEFIDKSHAALHDMADRYKLAEAESGTK